jgi:hypothetical protein
MGKTRVLIGEQAGIKSFHSLSFRHAARNDRHPVQRRENPRRTSRCIGHRPIWVFGTTEASHAAAQFAKPGNRQYTVLKNFPSFKSMNGYCNQQMICADA